MKEHHTDLVVLGAGPGGYAAAFYAADQGLDVTLVDKGNLLGGVCLNRGCIPSKALIHATQLIKKADSVQDFGIKFSKPRISLEKMRNKKDEIIKQLAMGIDHLALARKVTVKQAVGFFEDDHTLRIETSSGQELIHFKHAIVAAGSAPALPSAFDLGNSRIMTSTQALELEEIPENLLVIGGGYIGLELGMVYAYLQSKVTLVEASDSLLGGFDSELIRPLHKSVNALFSDVYLSSNVESLATKGKQIEAVITDKENKQTLLFDRVLVAVGRKPLSSNIGLEHAGVKLDDRGFVVVNDQQQSSVSNIYAIGDITGGVMLAHKASKEARIAVDALLGKPVLPLSSMVIPAVVFTDPELAWCGITEKEAKLKGIDFKVGKFSWKASGKALALGRTEGLSKIVYESSTQRILGVGIVGVLASSLISEAAIAIEGGYTLEDMAMVIHPHPTLSETLLEAAESALGIATHSVKK